MATPEPIILSGTDYERGRQHGELLRDEIRTVLDWRWQEIRSSPAHSAERLRECVRLHEEFSPSLADEVRGIADGAGVDRDEIYLLNGYHRYIVELGKRSSAENCSAFAARRSATDDGSTYLGQQWDFQIFLRDYTHFWLHDLPEGRRLLIGGFAGCAGLFGINSEGIGVMLNNLPVTGVQDGVGAFFIVRELLRCQAFDAAAELARRVSFFTCQNFLIGGTDGQWLDAELAVAGPRFISPQDDLYVHTNHYQHADLRRFNNKPAPEPCSCEPIQSTFFREPRMMELLTCKRGHINAGYLQQCVRDHDNAPAALCVHDFRGGNTNASIIANLTTREVWFTIGNPCMSEFRHVRLAKTA